MTSTFIVFRTETPNESDVRCIQRGLLWCYHVGLCDYYPGEPDGKFGTESQKALVSFRMKHGLAELGKISTEDVNVLKAAVNSAWDADPLSSRIAVQKVNEAQVVRKYPWFVFKTPWETRQEGTKVNRVTGEYLGRIVSAKNLGRPQCLGLEIPGSVPFRKWSTREERILRTIARSEGTVIDKEHGKTGYSGGYDTGNTWDWAHASWGLFHWTVGTGSLQPLLLEWAQTRSYPTMTERGFGINERGEPVSYEDAWPLDSKTLRDVEFSSVMQDICREAGFQQIQERHAMLYIKKGWDVAYEYFGDDLSERFLCAVASAYVNAGAGGLKKYIGLMNYHSHDADKLTVEFGRAWLRARGSIDDSGKLVGKTAVWRVNDILQTDWLDGQKLPIFK